VPLGAPPAPFFQTMLNPDAVNTQQNKLGAYKNTFANTIFTHNALPPPMTAANTYNLYDLSGKQRDITLRALIDVNPAAADRTANLAPAVQNVNYENTHTTIKPITHTITLDDKMFMLIPFTKPVEQHIFSPQKDIYNATLINTSQMASPTILTEPEEVQNFDKHLLNLGALNSYTSYIGNRPSYNTSLSNYKNFETNPIYNFIELLLRNNIRNIFDPNKALNYNNFGFDVGTIESLSGRGLLGGYNITDSSIYNRFVNIDNIASGNNEMEILGSAYNIDGSNSNDSALSDGKLLYSYIFKSDFNGGYIVDPQNPSRHMFTLILNYFHKYNISFNCMFNQLCYPSILFNASALRLSISRLKKLIERFNDYGNQDAAGAPSSTSYRSNVFKVVKAYIGNYIEDDTIALDKADDYRYQISFIEERKPFMSMEDVLNKLADNNGRGPDYDKNKLLWLCNQYSCPSVANNFLTEFLKYITIGAPNLPEGPDKDKLKSLQQLFASSIPEVFRHFDSLTTYVSVLFMLLKQTSYYSHEYDRDVSFFNVQNPEPFSVT